MGFRGIQVEGDSLTVIKKLQSRIADKSILHSIISDINNKRGCFDAITFSYVGRRGNEAAHALARIGLHNTGSVKCRRQWRKLCVET
ncbi:hypothetical protein V6N13_083686 [Hibiscus sabdariffa]|uniref:RNase H type-1 domain-containing protein n=1 Tax=Hibiscus sabdariffa TaxID=183260 RepID=A0ABR2SYT3_9ROSI